MGPSTQRAAIKGIKRVLNWGVEQGRIDRNPLMGVKMPRYRRRTKLIGADEHSQFIEAIRSTEGNAAVDRQFALALTALNHCGGRPQDVARVQVEHVDQGVTRWTIPEHKNERHTDAPRLVYLSPCLRTITRLLRTGRTEGPLFRGRRGGITTNAIKQRLKHLNKRLGTNAFAYAYRHIYITTAMQRAYRLPMAAAAARAVTDRPMVVNTDS